MSSQCFMDLLPLLFCLLAVGAALLAIPKLVSWHRWYAQLALLPTPAGGGGALGAGHVKVLANNRCVPAFTVLRPR